LTPSIKEETNMREVTKLPEFPKNELGLKRGTILKAVDPALMRTGIHPGDELMIGYDGKRVLCGPLYSWTIEQLVREIKYTKAWKVVGEFDLSSPDRSELFSLIIEQVKLISVQ
jgi:hypothetical protein